MALTVDDFFVPKKFSIRPGTVDYGKDYEVKIAALLSLRCIQYEMIHGMWLAMNVDECGAFDDIVLCIQTQDKKKITYLIQLKHKEKPSDIGAREFKAKKGDFLLAKYYDTIVQIKNAIDKGGTTDSEIINHLRLNHDTTVFILFTNRGTTENDFLKGIDKKSVIDNTWLLYQIIDTSGKISLFDYEKLDFNFEDSVRSYMEKLFLFTKQIHIDKLDAKIEDAIKNLIKPLQPSKQILNELVQKYVSFLTDWSKGELGGYYPLTKSYIFKVILEQLLTPYMVKLEKPEDAFVCNSTWNKIMEEKTVTIVESDNVVIEFLNGYMYNAIEDYCKNSKNKNLWKRHPDLVSKQILRITGRSKEVRPCAAYECLWKNGKLPLLLTVNNCQDFSNLLHIFDLFQKTFRVVVLVKGEIGLPYTNPKTLFRTFKDLNQEQTKEILKYPVQLQGRLLSMKLSDFVNEYLLHLVTVRDIIYILSGKFNVGNKFLPLPEIFIKRSLEKVWLKPKVLQEVTSDIFVIKCNPCCDLTLFLSKYLLLFSDSQVWQWNSIQSNSEWTEPRIITVKNESDLQQINNYYGSTTSKTIHYLILHDENNLEWVESFGTITNIIGFRKNLTFDNLELETTGKIVKGLFNKIILISACPGMGKSVLMDYIALHASTNMWVLRINLFDYVDYYKSEDFEDLEPSKYLQYFFGRILKEQKCDNHLVRTVFQKYLDSKNVLILLDGFDEIPISCQQRVSKMIKSLRNSNYSMYITTRPILKNHLEELLDTFAVTIKSFTIIDQTAFLRTYFAGTCGLLDFDSEGAQELIEKFVERLLSATKLNLNDQDHEFTGVPLQTKLLGEVFVEECKKYIKTRYFEDVQFDLLYLYKHFIEQKFKIVCAKFGNSSDDMLHHYKTYRSLYALRLLFAKHDLKELNIEERLKQVMQFFPDTLQQIQKDGIVVTESESHVTFVHRTFAEYLAAQWLSENINSENRKTVQTLIKTIFGPNFATVRNIFDRILSRDCPLHLAVINRQLDTAKQIILSNKSALTQTDKANRTFVHLIAAWGVHHPFNLKSVTEIKILYQLVAKDIMIEMLKLIPNEKLTSSKDDLLHCTQLDYAILSGSLNVADAICARMENVTQCISLTDININYSFYFINFPYGSLGSMLIRHAITTEMNDCMKQKRLSNCTEDEMHYAIINGDILKASSLLSLGKDVNKKDATGFTPLHTSAMFGQTLIAKLLLSNEADLTIRDNSGKTSLHWATAVGDFSIVILLLSIGIEVNAVDNYGMSSLHYAVVANTSDKTEILSALLKSYASITIQDNYGKTPLHYALHYNQMGIVKLLLDFGANINMRNENLLSSSENGNLNSDYLSEILASRDSDGGSVLHWAADKGFTNVVSLFLSYGARVEIEDDDGKTAMHWAAERGHSDVVTLLLSYGASINAKDNSGRTPLFLAVDSGNSDTVNLLLKKGASMQDKDDLGKTPLLQAIDKDSEEVIITLLSSGSCLDVKDNEDMDALHLAAWNGNTNVVKLLFSQQQGMSFEEKNSDSRTALISAALNGHTATVSLLLERGADIQATDKQSMTALLWASWNGHLKTAELLLLKGANLEAEDEFRRTPLICAAYNGHTTTVNLLILKGANVEAINDQGMNALNWAAYNGHIDVIYLLLTKGGAELETKSNHGRTALINAANNGHMVIVNTLLSKSADIEAKDIEGMNSLHCATCKGHNDIVNLLLAKGANLEAKSSYGKTALIYAADYGRATIVALLLSKGANVEAQDNENMSALSWASHNGHIDVVNLLLNIGANYEIKNRHGRTALICAAQNGHIPIVHLLIFKGANMVAQDNEGMGALHWAAYNGCIDIISLMLNNGLALDLKDGDGRTCLIHAAYNDHKTLLALLLFKGANVDEKDNEDMTALHWASLKGHTEVVNLLLSNGGNLEIRDKDGQTALMHAVISGHLFTVGLLLAKGADMEATDEKNATALHFAALKCYKHIAYLLLRIGANLEAKDGRGRTALIYAAANGDLAVVNLLLSRGANVELRDAEGLNAFEWAKRNGQESVASFLYK